MKYLIGLTIIFLSFSCNKGSDNNASPDVYVRAKVDGQAFSVGAVPGPGSTTGSYATFFKDENKLFIYGTGSTVYLVMTVQDFPKKTGTFSLGTIAGSIGSYTDASDPKNSIIYTMQGGRTGTLTVSSFDGKTMTGTFSYNVYSGQTKKEVKITEGEFKVPYTEI